MAAKAFFLFEHVAKAQGTGGFEVNLRRLHSPYVILTILDPDSPGYCHLFLTACLQVYSQILQKFSCDQAVICQTTEVFNFHEV